ncbi:hypothetical protein FQR65_LT04571 [Abscondita terminalis]|nr:hypothetical protein FQR65_LT04571 [Abscondita terminalis]
MSINIKKLKKLIPSKSSDVGNASDEVNPQVGFKIAYNDDTKQLKVRVIGARHLPSLYGNSKPEGYLIKVRVFPAREKFETSLVGNSWPTFNEEFCFTMQNVSAPNSENLFTGKFVVLTAYALLSNQENSKKAITKKSFKNFFSSLTESEDDKKRKRRTSSNRMSLTNRRTIGAVTYNLEYKFFTLELKNNFVGTPDIWRDLKDISSGLAVESRESKKGEVEVTLVYSNSEDGLNDLFEISLSRMRCSMSTMTDHEKLNGSLYIKMTSTRQDVLISKWKSDPFEPTISLKIEPQTAVLQTFVKNNDLLDVKMHIKLKCKNIVGKKTLLGAIVIDRNSKILTQVIKMPCTPITRMISLD